MRNLHKWVAKHEIERSEIPLGQTAFKPFEKKGAWFWIDQRTNLYGPYESESEADTIMARIQKTDARLIQMARESAEMGEYFRQCRCKVCGEMEDCNEFTYCQECWEDALDREDY